MAKKSTCIEAKILEIKSLKARTCVLPQSDLWPQCSQSRTRFKLFISKILLHKDLKQKGKPSISQCKTAQKFDLKACPLSAFLKFHRGPIDPALILKP